MDVNTAILTRRSIWKFVHLCIHGNGIGAVWWGVPQILEECFLIYKNTLWKMVNVIFNKK